MADITKDTVSIKLGVWINTGDYGPTSRDLAKSAKIAFEKVKEEPAPVQAPDEPPKARPKLPDASNLASSGQRH
ncbi:MAG: hypothetical protein EON57_07425 [Alphaproteobacteria bacterium]|nr:MAG: hypothetical protein EON57_07425 [Alphaproteobacteria bacterium]